MRIFQKQGNYCNFQDENCCYFGIGINNYFSTGLFFHGENYYFCGGQSLEVNTEPPLSGVHVF